MKPHRAFLFALAAALGVESVSGQSRLHDAVFRRKGKVATATLRFSVPVEIPFCRFTLIPEGSGSDLELLPGIKAERATDLEVSAAGARPGTYIFRYTILSTDGLQMDGGWKIVLE